MVRANAHTCCSSCTLSISNPRVSKVARTAFDATFSATCSTCSGVIVISVLQRDADARHVAELGAGRAATGAERIRVHLPASPGIDHHVVAGAGEDAGAEQRSYNPLMAGQRANLGADVLLDQASEQI